jgi:TonB family protein
MDSVSDYDSDCRILEIDPGASFEEIRQAYLDQTKVWHPDRFSNDVELRKKAEEKFKRINLAYQRLCGREPYALQVLNHSTERSPPGWTAVFALHRALGKRAIIITATAFLLGFALGGWLVPRGSGTWAKIKDLRRKIVEKARGTAQVAAPTVPSQVEALSASSADTTIPSSPTGHPEGDIFPWKTNVVTTVFWVGQEQVAGKTSPQHQSVWDKNWLKSFGGVDNPEPAARHDYIPISFVPRQNPFYCALPYNDVEQGRFKPEAPTVVPWFKRVHAEPGQSVCKDRWIAIRKGDSICYAQWEDCGPFRTDDFRYVFQNERPTPNASDGAGLSVSPAVRDYLGLAATDVADWRFVEVSDVPPGPWRDYGENNQFVISRHQLEKNLAQQPANLAVMEPAESATPSEDISMPYSAANVEEGSAEQKGSANSAAMEPAESATPAEENVTSSSAANGEKGLAEQKGSADHTATKSAQAHRSLNQSVMSASAAKGVMTYAPRPPYPQEARSHRIAGSGVCVVSVDSASGSVTSVSMAQSTGSPLLDKSVLNTVRTWKFKPGTVSKVSVPVEFKMTGTSDE